MAERRLLPVSQVAREFGCSKGTVYRLIKEGRIRALQLGIRRGLRIPVEEMLRFLQRGTAGADSDTSAS